MPKIFISYRRDDSRTITGRIYDRLSSEFGTDNIFRDLDGINLGADFRRVIEREVASCDFLLAIIGSRWATITDSQNRKRLDDPADFVRIEVETALRLPNVQVIPIFVDGLRGLSPADLPSTLADLPYRNAAVVRDDPDFHTDVDKLITSIKKLAPVSEPVIATAPPRTKTRLDFNFIIALLALILVLVVIATIANNLRQTAAPTSAPTFTAYPLPPTDTLTPHLFVPPVETATQSIQLDITATEIMLQRTIDAKQTAIAQTANAVPAATLTKELTIVFVPLNPSITPTLIGHLCEAVVVSKSNATVINVIRSQPSVNASIQQAITVGQNVLIRRKISDGDQNIWYELLITENKVAGWIPSEYISLLGSCSP